MEASRLSSFKENASYTICCEGEVHCGVWHWWCNTAPRCTSKADGKRCPLQHVPAAPTFVQRLGENDDTWWNRTSSFFTTMLLSWTSCAPGNGRFWNIHRTPRIWAHAIMIFSSKWKNQWERSDTTKDMNSLIPGKNQVSIFFNIF